MFCVNKSIRTTKVRLFHSKKCDVQIDLLWNVITIIRERRILLESVVDSIIHTILNRGSKKFKIPFNPSAT